MFVYGTIQRLLVNIELPDFIIEDARTSAHTNADLQEQFLTAVRLQMGLDAYRIANAIQQSGDDLVVMNDGSLFVHVTGVEPDVHCVTAGNGGCISDHPQCMHNLSPEELRLRPVSVLIGIGATLMCAKKAYVDNTP